MEALRAMIAPRLSLEPPRFSAEDMSKLWELTREFVIGTVIPAIARAFQLAVLFWVSKLTYRVTFPPDAGQLYR